MTFVNKYQRCSGKLQATLPSHARRNASLKHSLYLFSMLLCLVSTAAFANESLANEPLECLIEPHLLIEVSSSEIGVLATVPVDTADAVRTGDVIAALRTDVENAAVAVSRTRASSNSEIDLLQYDYKFNVRKRDRFDELLQKRMVSAQDIDEVQAAKDAAQLRLQAATEKQHRTQLEAVRDELALSRRIVRSPIDGVVVRRYKTAGEYVDGDPILQLAQLDPLRIEVVVPISLYGQIQVGMQATVSPELPIAGPFVATVTNIDPVMDAATATFGVRLSLPNPSHRLPPGLRCTLVLDPVHATPADATETAAESATPTSSEPEIQAAVAVTDTQDKDASQRSDSADSDSCVTLGPIIDAAHEDQLVSLLNTNDVTFLPRYESTTQTGSPWTVLSKNAHANPQELIQQLGAAGINDIQWLRSGPRKHHFSFGRYRAEINAKNRVASMLALGFEAEMVPFKKTESTLWFDLARDLTDTALSKITSEIADSPSGLSLMPISCAQSASW